MHHLAESLVLFGSDYAVFDFYVEFTDYFDARTGLALAYADAYASHPGLAVFDIDRLSDETVLRGSGKSEAKIWRPEPGSNR